MSDTKSKPKKKQISLKTTLETDISLEYFQELTIQRQTVIMVIFNQYKVKIEEESITIKSFNVLDAGIDRVKLHIVAILDEDAASLIQEEPLN